MKDYIVVGLGIAGIAMSESLRAAGREFIVFDKGFEESSTLVAGGIYNPVVLKRLKMAWKADEQMPVARNFYNELQEQLQVHFHQEIDVVRRLASKEEENDWFHAADKPGLSRILHDQLIRNDNPGIDAPNGFGKVLAVGKVDTAKLMTAYRDQLRKQNRIDEQDFDATLLEVHKDHFSYKGQAARKIVFCTGFGMAQNPYFNYLPLRGNKGEYVKVRIRGLNEEKVIKAGVFLIPEGDDVYTVGATYNRENLNREPTGAARSYLLDKLQALTPLKAEVIGQTTGIRPTVPDRKPLVGEHPEIKGMYLLNGFGSRGLMIAPLAARQLLGLMEEQLPLPPEMDLQRFTRKWFKPSN